jgi:hypothetical protein
MYDLGPGKIKGYKSPNDIWRPYALPAIRKYWPKTKLVIGVRHPIKHFESYYNYHVNRRAYPMLPAEKMFGRKLPRQLLFHYNLALLGKTNIQDPKEADLLDHHWPEQPQLTTNPVFFFEATQTFDTTDDRDLQFASDLERYLGLTEPMQMTHRLQPRPSLWKRIYNLFHWKNSTETSARAPGRESRRIVIDICEDKYTRVRTDLLQHGAKASEWIQTYFLNHSDVTFSNKTQLTKLLDTWKTDPCELKAGESPNNPTSDDGDP